MGTRAYGDVELAQKRLSADAAEREPSSPYPSGASVAYRWALGCVDRSPVTGAGDAEGVADLQALTAEVEAAVVLKSIPVGASATSAILTVRRNSTSTESRHLPYCCASMYMTRRRDRSGSTSTASQMTVDRACGRWVGIESRYERSLITAVVTS